MSARIRDLDEYERGSKWFAHWHREQPDPTAKMVDLDGVGYCHRCSMPIYLVEATKATARKNATVTENLGRLAGLEVFVFYLDRNRPGVFYVDWRSADMRQWMTPEAAWNLLLSVRRTHLCGSTNQQKGA